jgi:hypothetical protein
MISVHSVLTLRFSQVQTNVVHWHQRQGKKHVCDMCCRNGPEKASGIAVAEYRTVFKSMCSRTIREIRLWGRTAAVYSSES